MTSASTQNNTTSEDQTPQTDSSASQTSIDQPRNAVPSGRGEAIPLRQDTTDSNASSGSHTSNITGDGMWDDPDQYGFGGLYRSDTAGTDHNANALWANPDEAVYMEEDQGRDTARTERGPSEDREESEQDVNRKL
ncbi:uncharacterized protein I206_101632 [Kwoniella pini CBS 10737]|uniref:Uncharacterized protein n=1 Tax=Kwoniella pini CBS 10737 TaxID=1296096 RepID=A0A1B9HW41_9TREE|nr:uncharacterized protein I206_06398 [Kwoniella pini CBS 10737]OCF47497.1 hypothetical protein I206_06398 [Kwoniella pini CBS 10737]